jgi:hypothetical protein
VPLRSSFLGFLRRREGLGGSQRQGGRNLTELSPFADRWARSSVPSDTWAHMLAVADVMLPLPAACTRSQPKHFNEHLMCE